MASGETPSGTTEKLDLSKEVDLSLMLYKYHRAVNLDPVIELFGRTEYDAAIMRAYVCSVDKTDTEFHRFDVVDAFGMLIVRFVARWVIVGEQQYTGRS